MKRVTALLMLLAGMVAADAAPPAEDVVADLVVGQCLSETRKTALPAGYIDARKIGMPLRIPTATGAVYYDRAGDYCKVHASGIDSARVLASLDQALGRLRLKFEKHNVRYDDNTKTNPERSCRTVTPQPRDPGALSIGVVAGR